MKPSDVPKIVGEALEVSPELITSPCRRTEAHDARCITIRLWQTHWRLSTTDIGKRLNRDHSAIVYANQRTKQLLETNPAFQRKLRLAEERFERIERNEDVYEGSECL